MTGDATAPFFKGDQANIWHVTDPNGMEYNLAQEMLTFASSGAPFHMFAGDPQNRWGHVLSADRVEIPATRLAAARHDWKELGYTDSAIDSFIENWSNPAEYEITFDDDFGVAQLEITRAFGAGIESMFPEALPLMDSPIAQLIFGFSKYSTDSTYPAHVHFNSAGEEVVVGQAVLDRMRDISAARQLVSGRIQTGRQPVKASSVNEWYEDFVGTAGGQNTTYTDRNEKTQASISNSIRTCFYPNGDGTADPLLFNEIFGQALPLITAFTGSSPGEGAGKTVVEKIGDWSDLSAYGVPETFDTSSYSQLSLESEPDKAFSINHFKTFIAEYPLNPHDYFVISCYGVYLVRDAMSDPLAPFIRALVCTLKGGTIGIRGTTYVGGWSIEPILEKKFWGTEKFTQARAETSESWTYPADEWSLLPHGDDTVEVRFWRRVGLEYWKQNETFVVNETIDEAEFNPFTEWLNVLRGDTDSTKEEFMFWKFGTTYATSWKWGDNGSTNVYVANTRKLGPTPVPIGDKIAGMWPDSLPLKGLCYTALPSVAREIYTFSSSFRFDHQDGYTVVRLDDQMIRIALQLDKIMELMDYKASVEGLSEDDKSKLTTAKSNVGDNTGKLIYYTEYRQPIELVEDCVKTLRLYSKFKDAVDVYGLELVPAQNGKTALTFKAAQNRVNGNLSRRIFAHAANEKLIPQQPFDYDIDRVRVHLTPAEGAGYVATLVWDTNGIPVPTGSSLTPGEAKVWFFYGAKMSVDDPTIPENDKLAYAMTIFFGKDSEGLRAEVGDPPPSGEYELDLVGLLDPRGFFNWNFIPPSERGQGSLLIAGIPANDELALMVKRLAGVNVASAHVNPLVFEGIWEK